MARTTLEMFIKVLGANKAAKELDNVSDSAEKTHNQVNKNTKENAKFAAGMSSLTKGAIAGAALFAGKQLLDFAQSSIIAASSAQEAAGAFGTTFGEAAEQLGEQLSKNANLFGLTTSEAKQLIGVFGAVAQGMGFTQGESADLSSRLFELSGDIASFNNITAGAEPVLRAFQSAIVGEREALKTYGIAISEAEVQTKAFEMTGKTSADALTRQEKALATTELLFSKASVQIGNAQREAEGFAAQMLQTRAKTQELREEVGQELLPAAGELIGVFNNFVDNVSPAVVTGFGLINDAIVATVDASQKGTSALEKYFRIFILGQAALYGNEEAVEEFNKALDENRKITNQNSAQIVTSTGISMEFMDIVSGLNKLYAETNENLQKNRSQILINTTQTKKYGDEIDNRFNPIFGEQNSLILTNIQLETDRKKLLDLITNANTGVAQATAQRNQAAKELNELQIQENVRDAEAAIRKAELQTQIALLNDAKANGKDVTLDLALAEAELAEAEFELANDSDRLTLARERLDIAEQNLQRAIENQEKAIEERNSQLIRSIELTNEQTQANKNLASTITGLEGTDFGRLVEQGFVSLGAPETTPAPVVAPQTTVSAPATGGGGQEIQITSNVVIEEETIATTVQKVNTRLQQQGKTFAIR
jgi:hypothetical protein